MVIRLVVSRAAVGLVAVGLGVAASASLRPGQCAQGMRISLSGKKAANELGVQTWQEFLKECRAS